MRTIQTLLGAFLTVCALLLASVDWEVKTPEPLPTYDQIEAVSIESEAVFSRSSEEIEFETYHVTAFCICEKCCGKTDGIGASGEKLVPGVSIASVLPFGTEVWIEGIGMRTVQDRGSAISDGELDLLMEDHQKALEFGSQYLKVRVME